MYDKNLVKILLVSVIAMASYAIVSARLNDPGPPASPGPGLDPRRIVSITPAGTEILFDLGLGSRVVAVTKYCTWPPEARDRIVLPDMLDIDMESLAALSPDLVVISNMNSSLLERLNKLSYPVVRVDQDDWDEICASIIRVGEACGVPEQAAERVEALRAQTAALAARSPDDAPRVLVCVGRDPADKAMTSVYVAGTASFYQDLLAAAGARNAIELPVPYAHLSREGLLRANPDIVLELIGDSGMGENLTTDMVLEPWRKITDLRAVQSGDVAVIRGDFTLRAGPRYPKVLAAFISAIHGGLREIGEE